jgi:hypothetical protein
MKKIIFTLGLSIFVIATHAQVIKNDPSNEIKGEVITSTPSTPTAPKAISNTISILLKLPKGDNVNFSAIESENIQVMVNGTITITGQQAQLVFFSTSDKSIPTTTVTGTFVNNVFQLSKKLANNNKLVINGWLKCTGLNYYAEDVEFGVLSATNEPISFGRANLFSSTNNNIGTCTPPVSNTRKRMEIKEYVPPAEKKTPEDTRSYWQQFKDWFNSKLGG